jgi:4-amino-4-deoxy-L-arabinose transferase-like glycosyltransferase
MDGARLVLVLLAACSLFLTQLQAPLLEPQEPRYAEIAREMLTSGDWLTPTLDGAPYLDKPPLLYWLTAASYRIFGIHDWAARLVPGLAGVLTVLVTWLWGRATAGSAVAFWGALILALSARFVYLGRMLTFDGLLCLWVTTALAAAHVALNGPRPRWSWWLLSAGACGLGLLTKGPVALALVSPPLLALGFLDKRSVRLTAGLVAGYLGVASLVAGPWFAAVIWRHPEFAGYFFWTHNVVRFLAPFDHGEPFWFHLPGLLLGLLPWSLLLPGLLAALLRPQSAFDLSFRADQRETINQRIDPMRLADLRVLAWMWGLLFFSLSGCKRAGYILPVVPPLALSLGCYLTQQLPARRAGRASALILLLGLGIVAVAWNNRLLPLGPAALLGTALLVLVLLLRLDSLRTWPACAGMTWLLLLGGVQMLLPAYNSQFALRQHLHAHEEELQSGQVPVICTPHRLDSVSFYLPQAQVKVFSAEQRTELLHELQAHPESLLLVKSGRLIQELLRELPESMEVVPRNPQGAVLVAWVRNGEMPPRREAAVRLRVSAKPITD